MSNPNYPNEPPQPGRPYSFVEARIQWPSIVAGAFIAFSLFVVSVVLARACGVDVTFREAHTRGTEVGAIIWGGVAAIICFGIGALIAGRNAAAAGSRVGWLNGLLVWAVAVPILIYGLGSGLGPRLGQTQEFGGGKGEPGVALPAAAHVAPEGGTETGVAAPVVTGSSGTVSHAQAAAWWTLLSLGLGLLAAIAGGAMAQGAGHHYPTAGTRSPAL